MPPEAKELERICESDSKECSGTTPCGKCYYLILTHVIPGAMRAGGFGGDKSQAEAFLKAYAGGWKKLLEEKVADKKAKKPSSFTPPPQLLEFFAFREAARMKESAASVQVVVEPETKTKSPETTGMKSAKKKGSKLLKGDLRRMVEKQANEPLANGTGTGGGRRDSSEEPAKRDEEKH